MIDLGDIANKNIEIIEKNCISFMRVI